MEVVNTMRYFLFTSLCILLLTACQPVPGANGNAAQGAALFNQKYFKGSDEIYGCIQCHSVTPNEVIVGPSLAGVATRSEKTIKDPAYKGKAKTAPEYLQESILDPNAYYDFEHVDDIMFPEYRKHLSGQEVNDLVAYLLTLK